MPPRLLFCDSDCLIQLFIARQVALLRWLAESYSLESVIVPEVEAELAFHLKFKTRFDPDLRRALSSGAVSLFDYSRPEQRLAEFFSVPAAASAASAAMTRAGRTYALRLGDGEAYSHAVAVHLGMPLLSHDRNAIDTLRENRLQAAAPTLRVFDLVGFAFQRGQIDIKQCEAIRKTLMGAREWVPRVFASTSYEKGRGHFNRRLYDICEFTGKVPPDCREFYDPLYLQPK
jgi:hypothetical protein